jgi:predicted restriction endonuclease
MKQKIKLLTRTEFSEKVMQRDNKKCVFCGEPATSAHHIIERKLFNDGGYYLDNGASVCDLHHWQCEKTDISVEDVRKSCKILNKIVPNHFDINQSYDKWGNVVLEDGTRLKGEMFYLENVQKILKDKIYLFK